MKLAETYKDWKDGSGKALVAAEGGKGAPWRIYEGHTMPLLTALMKGTKRLEKVYDGNVFATTDPHITLVHTGKDVGTYDAYSDQFGYDLIGGAAIKSRVLTMSGVAAQSKTYDGTTAADISKFHATLNNVVSGEESLVTATATGATYNSKDVRAANTVNYTGVALGGTGAGNYTLAASTAQGAGSIKAKQLNLALTSGARFDKTYDGNANVTQTLTKGTNYSLTGFIGTEGDHLALAAATGTYTAGKDAAVNKGVTFDGLSLTGTGAGNYTLDKTTLTGIGTISPKQLNLALTSSARFDKTYDGTANVTQTLTKGTNYTLTNFVNGEGADIALAPVTGTYTDKSAGTGKTVTFGGLTLTGTGAGNYVLNSPTLTGTGTIARRALTLGAVAAQSKTYDGTTSADASKFRAALNNVVAGDSVTTTATGAAYNDKNVAGASTISYTGVGLTGADAGNYTLAATAAQGTGSITHRDLTLTADAKSIAQGEALPSFTGHADGFADGEDESVFGTDTLTFDTAVTNTDRLGSYGVTGRIGSVSEGIRGNYRIRQAAGNATAFTIHAANLLGDIRAANLPGGILAALVQDAAPRFDMGFGQEVYVFGTPRPVRAATLGLYRFDAERGLETQGLNL